MRHFFAIHHERGFANEGTVLLFDTREERNRAIADQPASLYPINRREALAYARSDRFGTDLNLIRFSDEAAEALGLD